MSDELHVDEAALKSIQQELTTLGSGLAEVSGSSYVRSNVFSESTGQSASIMEAMLPSLAQCASLMTGMVADMANYLQSVIDGLDEADVSAALEAAHLNSPKVGG